LRLEIANTLKDEDVEFVRSLALEQEKNAITKDTIVNLAYQYWRWAKGHIDSYRAIVAYDGIRGNSARVIVSTFKFQHGRSVAEIAVESFKEVCRFLKEGRIIAAFCGKEFHVKLFPWMRYFRDLSPTASSS